ncbi:MAG: GNAT family N-acetyltransferase [Bacteroidota bacterium]
MNYKVRKATLDDLPTLLNFEQGLIEAERPMDNCIREGKISYYSISDFIKGELSEVYVVELASEIVASGYARIMDDRPYFKHSKIGYLGFMFVPEQHRGNGYNQLVLDALLAWCKERNVLEIRLDVYDVNQPALRAYEKAGFKKYLINMRLSLED